MPCQAVLLHFTLCECPRGSGNHWRTLLTTVPGHIIWPTVGAAMVLAPSRLTAILAHLVRLWLIHHHLKVMHHVEFVVIRSYGPATLAVAPKVAALHV